MLRATSGLIGAILLCAPISALAQDVVQSTGSFFNWVPPGTPTGTRAVGFFDGPSDDVPGWPAVPSGPGCSIAYFLQGVEDPNCQKWGGPGGTLIPTPPGALPFLAQGSPGTPAGFTFHPVCAKPRTVTLKLVYAGWNATNQFGWYLVSNPSVLFPLVGGGTGKTVNQPVSFTPLGDFGYYIRTGDGQTYLSGSSSNFVLFTQNPGDTTTANSTRSLLNYWVGVEDKPIPAGPLGSGVLPNGTDADYNDIVVQVMVEACPTEPPPPNMGCTLTQGGYKNRFNSKVVGLTIGGVFYTKAQVNEILANNAVRGNGLISLAHQLVTAKLNVFYNGGVAPPAVLKAISDADALIASLQDGGVKAVPPIGDGVLAPSTTSALTTILDRYNNGLALGGPAHCK